MSKEDLMAIIVCNQSDGLMKQWAKECLDKVLGNK